jgi:glycosyltransferase involved in cell wall biosynthesis
MERVVLVGPRPGARGGIAQFTAHLYRALEGRTDVRWLAYARLYPAWTAAGRNESVLDPAGSPADEAPLLAWRAATWRHAAARIGELRPTDVVMQWWHPAFGPSLRALARAAHRAGARATFVCHNAAPHERFPFGERLTRAALGEADRLIALSEATAGELRALVPNTPVEVLPHPAYAFPVVPAAPAAWRARIGGGRPVIAFFGYVRPYKGLADLIDALPLVRRTHPDAVLVVAGPFLEGPERSANRAARAGVGAAVRLFPGYVPDEDVGGLFAASDVLVLPYRSASQSGVLPQALAAGLPVVATEVGGLAEALGRGGETVPPRDPGALAAGIVRALAAGRRAPGGSDGWETWRRAILRAEGRVAA